MKFGRKNNIIGSKRFSPNRRDNVPKITVKWVINNYLGRKEFQSMRQFDYSYLADRTWDNEIMSYISKIHEYKGKQELFLRQRPVELNRLIEIAKIQSTEWSNEATGIILSVFNALFRNRGSVRNES